MIRIRKDNLMGPEIAASLQEYLEDSAKHSPPESMHALDLDALKAPDITIWTAWEDSDLIGCGALKELSTDHGEIKSMRTDEAHLRKGVAANMLQFLISESKRRSYKRLSLETGSMAAFAPAQTLYARFGFEFCEPFANYTLDPYSKFMTLTL